MTRKVYGITEIAQALGVKRQTVAQWHHRGKLPPADEELSMGPVWFAETIEPWMFQKQGKTEEEKNGSR